MFGQLPPKLALPAKVKRVDHAALAGKATLSEVTLRFGPPETPPIHLMLVVPNHRTAPAPVVLALNYFGNHTLVHDKNVRLPDNWMPGWGHGTADAPPKGQPFAPKAEPINKFFWPKGLHRVAL